MNTAVNQARSLAMTDFPHHYRANATADPQGDVVLESDGLPQLRSMPPKQFGGSGDRWSPETLLVAAVADCFVLTFRAIARVAKLSWVSLTCDVTGTLDRVERVTSFTSFVLRATLDVPPGTNVDSATQLLTRAEHGCLISASLKAACAFEPIVHVNDLRESA
jgi:organic hydroperoxide reductase OsmC/OhrA